MPARTATEDPSDQQVVDLINPSGTGAFVLVCEHASNFIPPDLNSLGLHHDALTSHIAWDPGALAVAREMSRILDAPLVAPTMSRLVYDCNRPPEAPSAVATASETYDIPGNSALSQADRVDRALRCYAPFRDSLAACIERRIADGKSPAVLTIHSFTPVYNGVKRDVDIGVLHDTDGRFADTFLHMTASDSRYIIRRNAPYGPEDGVTHTLKTQAVSRGLLNAMIEIRNDLIETEAEQRAMAEWLAGHAGAALRKWKADNA